MNKIDSYFLSIFAIGLIMASSVIILLIFGEQEITCNHNISCEEIRDCILLDLNCFDVHVYNKLFFIEWEFEQRANTNNQKMIYKKNCLTGENNE